MRGFCSSSTLWRVKPSTQFVLSPSFLCPYMSTSLWLVFQQYTVHVCVPESTWRGISVDILAMLRAGRLRSRDSIVGKGNRFFFPPQRSVPWPTVLSISWVGRRCFLRSKRRERETNNLLHLVPMLRIHAALPSLPTSRHVMVLNITQGTFHPNRYKFLF